ncbi:MAG: sensor histidine kinase [Bacteroidia bacterium]
MNKNRLVAYWLCNTAGWLIYVVLFALLNLSRGQNQGQAGLFLFILFFGLFFTHLYRYLIIRSDWLRMEWLKLIPRLLLTVSILASLFGYITVWVMVSLFVEGGATHAELLPVSGEMYFSTILGYMLIFVLWTLLYFAVHYFTNYKKSEIENLKWQASIHEIELNKLKSQLNPHFMFNSMNSIRALVDENPPKAKEAVTQLANILRNTLMMGRSKLVPFDDELKVLKDYLGLEAIRLEERLQVRLDIEQECSRAEIPPLMLQTLSENAIKHGIARLTGGGKLEVNARIKDEMLYIQIRNSGYYAENNRPETGFGIANTLQRLHLLYNGKARFRILNESEQIVLTELIIPIHESPDH